MVPWVEGAALNSQRCLTQVLASFWDVETIISNCRVLSSPGKLWQSLPSRLMKYRVSLDSGYRSLPVNQEIVTRGIVGKIGCRGRAGHTSNPCTVVVDFMRIRTHEKESSASLPLFPDFQLPLVVKC